MLPRIEDDSRTVRARPRRATSAASSWRGGPAAVTVVLASPGYPDAPETGVPIGGIEDAEAAGALVFHAGTALRDGELVSAGGRVLGITGLGATLAERASARTRAPSESGSPAPSTAATSRRTRSVSHAEIHPTPPTEEAPSPLSVIDEFERDRSVGDPHRLRVRPRADGGAIDELDSRGISNELRVLSAHRNPRGVADYAASAAVRGIRVIIAAAGMAAALPGVVAANTDLPVIGVPLTLARRASSGGLDAILSIVQMPPGVPVACVSLNGAKNAAILAAKILAQGGGYPDDPRRPQAEK